MRGRCTNITSLKLSPSEDAVSGIKTSGKRSNLMFRIKFGVSGPEAQHSCVPFIYGSTLGGPGLEPPFAAACGTRRNALRLYWRQLAPRRTYRAPLDVTIAFHNLPRRIRQRSLTAPQGQATGRGTRRWRSPPSHRQAPTPRVWALWWSS